MKSNKLDIFEKNAEFFERFNNSLEDTSKDRHDRTRFTVTGLENKVEFAVSGAQGRIKKAEQDAIDRINGEEGFNRQDLVNESVGDGKWVRDSEINDLISAQYVDDSISNLRNEGLESVVTEVIEDDEKIPSAGAVYRALGSSPGGDLSEYRKLDNLEFVGFMQVKAESDVGTGVFLVCPDGKVRGQMIYNNYGLQFAQIQEDGSYQTFTFPRFGEGGEIVIKSQLEELKAEIALLKGKLNE